MALPRQVVLDLSALVQHDEVSNRKPGPKRTRKKKDHKNEIRMKKRHISTQYSQFLNETERILDDPSRAGA